MILLSQSLKTANRHGGPQLYKKFNINNMGSMITNNSAPLHTDDNNPYLVYCGSRVYTANIEPLLHYQAFTDTTQHSMRMQDAGRRTGGSWPAWPPGNPPAPFAPPPARLCSV